MPQTQADATAHAKQTTPDYWQIDEAATDADDGKNAEEGDPKDTTKYKCKNKEKFSAAESSRARERWWAGR